MGEKKKNCGCGCIPLKQLGKKATKDQKDAKKSKKQVLLASFQEGEQVEDIDLLPF